MAIQTLQANVALGETLFLVNEEGRGLQVTPSLLVNSFAAVVTDWFVDAATPAPLAKQDGRSAATAFATTEQLANTMCPGGQTLTFAATNLTPVVHIAAGTYGTLALSINWAPGLAFFAGQFTILGTVTSSAVIALGSITAQNAAANIRGEITTGAGAFVPQKRVRVTAGTNQGALTYSTGLNGPATDSFVGGWLNFATGSQTPPVPGNSLVVDTLQTTIDTVVLNSIGSAGGYGVVQDCSVKNFFSLSQTAGSGYTGGPYLFGCILDVGIFEAVGGFTLWSCAVRNIQLTGDFISMQGCSIQGDVSVTAQTNITVGLPSVLDGGTFSFSTASNAGGSSSFRTGTPLEHENGAGKTAYSLGPGCFIFTGAKMWGGAASAYALKANLQSGAWIYNSPTVANWAFPSTADFQVTGHAIAVAGCPLGYPRANCGIANSPDPAAVAVTI